MLSICLDKEIGPSYQNVNFLYLLHATLGTPKHKLYTAKRILHVLLPYKFKYNVMKNYMALDQIV